MSNLPIDQIICGDVLDILPKLPANSVDLIFADPPFNVGKAYQDNRADYHLWCRRWIGLCFRLLKPTGSFYLMTLSKHLEWKMPIMALHGKFINLIIWRNVSASHNKRQFWCEYQPIMLYGKTDDYIFNTYAQYCEGVTFWAKERNTNAKGQMKDRWDDITNIYAGSISHPEALIQSGTNKKAHPCQMPIGLAARAILFSTNEDAVMLDPFIGSGTTAIAAIRTNRHYIGIELEQGFVDLANERIRVENSQLKLDLGGGK